MVELARGTVLAVLAVLVLVTGAGVATAVSDTLELQAAESGESDSTTLSYTFTAQANGTADVTPVSDSQSGGDVQFDLVSSSSFSVEAGQSYTVEYEVTAEDGASEGTYDIFSEVQGPGGTYTETVSVEVDVLRPEFGSVGSQTTDVSFDGDSSESTTLDVDFENTGEGVMKGVAGSANGVPSGMSVSVSTPDEVSAGDTGTATVDVTVDESVSEGDYQFTVELTDSLGNTESFTVTVTVEKPPALTAPDREIDLGDILKGRSESAQFTLEESYGYQDIQGIDVTYEERDADGQLTLSGVRDAYIPAGGSTTAGVEIQVDAGAEQHRELEWQTELQPEDPAGDGTTITFRARVIYPPYYESVSAPDRTLTFDEPRSERSEFTTTVPVTVENGGDQPMQITEVTPTISGSELSARVASDAPDTIPAQSSRRIDVVVTATTAAAEGDRSLAVDISAQQPGQTTARATVTIDHETEVVIGSSELTYGRVVATRTVTRSTGLSERLGYQDVENLTIRRVSGPDNGWLTVTEQPSQLGAGESAPFVTSITFDTRAEFFTQYSWTYRVDGDNIEPKTITITAVPRPVDFTETAEELKAVEEQASAERATAAGSMATAMEQLAEKLRENSTRTAKRDVTIVSAAGRSTALFVRNTITAREQIDAGNHSGAQRSLTRAAAAFGTIDDATRRVETRGISSQVNRSASASRSVLSQLIDEQRSHYRERLEAENTTMLERAQTYRRLASLAELAGNSEEAVALRNRSQSSFERYSSLVSNGNADLQAARAGRANLTSMALLTVGGRPVFWVGDLDSVSRQRAAVTAAYTDAQEQFATAGATSRAQTARSERLAFEGTMEQARLLSTGLAGVIALLFIVVIGLEARALYRYVQESAAAVSGDFLLASDTA